MRIVVIVGNGLIGTKLAGAQAVVSLASDEGALVVDSEFVIDGGMRNP